jgi:polyhydroxyalkanoate synthase subunit PhaC
MNNSLVVENSRVLEPSTGQFQSDGYLNAQYSKLTGGLSPLALITAYQDWMTHLVCNPSRQAALYQKWLDSLMQIGVYGLKSSTQTCESCPELLETDRRFSADLWRAWPFNLLSQTFLHAERWWDDASTDVHGVSQHHEDVVRFLNRQLLNANSPANFLLSNPEVLNLTLKTGGKNLWKGLENLLDRENRLKNHQPPFGGELYEVGKQVAITPGKVVYRNRLIELIQYEPTTAKVHPEPILIVSAWIMKYYILDLSPSNSMIKYLVDKGHTVFAISWLNPGPEDRNLGLNDYVDMGIMASLDAINSIVPDKKIHAVGYCIAGTVLSAAAASMGGNDDDRLASITLFASQTDFTEVGELSIFIDDAQIAFLEDIMSENGYLDSKYMNGAFQLLNSSDLLWSRILKNYLMGQRQPVNDLAAWNSDGTRLPYRMHSESLRHFFLNNELASGKYHHNGKAVNLMSINCPIFCVATVKDHIAPWQSVYKLNLLTYVEIEFVLTSGGHNAGIVNPPTSNIGEFKSLTRNREERYINPESWLQVADSHQGSWWPHWNKWLSHLSGTNVKPPPMGSEAYPPLCNAPGTYVLIK